ncbi:hypothetical protein HK098_001083 [Nowakowskiella sp. JEL0407]|nr:hypothetical protein HK098_001083 [Nowakowskiella sp. JEL0407]
MSVLVQPCSKGVMANNDVEIDVFQQQLASSWNFDEKSNGLHPENSDVSHYPPAPDDLVSEPDLDLLLKPLDSTIRHMFQRRIIRARTGKYKQRAWNQFLWQSKKDYILYPKLLFSKRIIAKNWWGITLAPGSKNHFHFLRRDFKHISRQRGIFRYKGEKNEDNVPHGIGEWIDSTAQGERLVGYWENGIPVGPFRSREYGTGNGFASIRIGFVKTGAEPWDKHAWTPKRAVPSYGVITVESSITGQFYSHLPDVKVILGPTAMSAGGPEYVVKEIAKGDAFYNSYYSVPSSYDDQPYAMATDFGPLSVKNKHGNLLLHHPGFQLAPTNDKFTSLLVPASTEPSSSNNPDPPEKDVNQINNQEALVFVHGYNSSLLGSGITLGQMLSLGAFPPHIRPFIYNWPSASALSFFDAVAYASSDNAKQDFIAFINELRIAGFHGIHFIGHSLGSKLLLNCVEELDAIFTDAGVFDPTDERLMLYSFTLFNPVDDVKYFVLNQYGTSQIHLLKHIH